MQRYTILLYHLIPIYIGLAYVGPSISLCLNDLCLHFQWYINLLEYVCYLNIAVVAEECRRLLIVLHQHSQYYFCLLIWEQVLKLKCVNYDLELDRHFKSEPRMSQLAININSTSYSAIIILIYFLFCVRLSPDCFH